MSYSRQLTATVDEWRAHARKKRGEIFLASFPILPSTRILDIGSEDGSNIASLLHATAASPACVHIADIDEAAVEKGRRNYGFVPVVLQELAGLPFPDRYFDIVYCSSVIEHVTVPKRDMWEVTSDYEFAARAAESQRYFAQEIRRVAKGYFVQTPSRGFPVESHTWLPFLGYLPRPVQIPLIRAANRLWIKGTVPDFRLLAIADMRDLFPDAEVVTEQVWGLTKSLMAIKRMEERPR